MPVDNAVALEQMTAAMTELGSRRPASRKNAGADDRAGRWPRLLTLGGDHSAALVALGALRKVHGAPVAVVHFDAHLDTWKPPSSAADSRRFPSLEGSTTGTSSRCRGRRAS